VQAGLFAGMTAGAEFSAATELAKIFLYYLPSLALIWYLLFKAGRVEIPAFKLGKKDLISGLITLPCLLFIGFAISLISIKISGSSVQLTLYSPSSIPGWILLCITCFCSAYLEESFFRYYLLSKRAKFNISASLALVLSTALFSICHTYGGPWGVLNAAISGFVLGFMFLKFKSLHGIAIAHGLYNITAYVLNSL
jgi:hypothetical protein